MPRHKKTPNEIENAKQIGERIKRSRTKRRIHSDYEPMTQKELANKAGIYHVTLCYYECGKITPSVEAITKIAKALRVKVQYLLYGNTK